MGGEFKTRWQPSTRLLIGFISLLLIGLNACGTAKKANRHDAPLLPGMTAQKANGAPKPASSPIATEDDDLSDAEVAAIENEPVPAAVSRQAESATLETDDLDAQGLDDESGAVPGQKTHDIPFEFNRKVAAWIEYFSQKDRDRFQRFLDRGEPYREAVENILEENNVPIDLYYLGLIESGFNFRAKSKAKAVGVWQFMRPTGKLYGLSVDPYVDERRDPIRATEAAAWMLRDLHREFKSWYLAMAAYNAGVGRIRHAVKKGRSNNFWTLVERKVLPKETMEYVPKFLAARYIAENPDVFAFYINEEQKYPDVNLVKVPSPVGFGTIEKMCSIPSGTLSFVNPHYLKDCTHPAKKTDEIWVPVQYQKTVEDHYAQLSLNRAAVKSERVKIKPKSEKVHVYVVKKGDTLKTIAKKRGLSVAYLNQVNHFKSGRGDARLRVGQKINLSATSYQQTKTHPRKKKRRSK